MASSIPSVSSTPSIAESASASAVSSLVEAEAMSLDAGESDQKISLFWPGEDKPLLEIKISDLPEDCLWKVLATTTDDHNNRFEFKASVNTANEEANILQAEKWMAEVICEHLQSVIGNPIGIWGDKIPNTDQYVRQSVVMRKPVLSQNIVRRRILVNNAKLGPHWLKMEHAQPFDSRDKTILDWVKLRCYTLYYGLEQLDACISAKIKAIVAGVKNPPEGRGWEEVKETAELQDKWLPKGHDAKDDK